MGVWILAGAAAFNLICTGTVEQLQPGNTTKEPYSRTYRLDLDAGRWCEDGCLILHPIADIQPSKIMLKNVKTDTPREYLIERESVDRLTGEHSFMTESGPNRGSTFGKGHCEKAAFGGFPRLQTKF